MTGSCGRWLTLKEYAEASGIPEGEAGAHARSHGLLTKASAGQEYVWVDDPAAPGSQEPRPDSEEGGEAGTTGLDRSGVGDEEAVDGEALVSRFSGAQELAHQAERAISLVERSMGTFIMMHQEVVKEKERFIELSKEGVLEREQRIDELNERIEQLEQILREKEQELADLKMLVEILEGRSARQRKAESVPLEVRERASVGDLMEEQLKYLMEDQMVSELLKE